MMSLPAWLSGPMFRWGSLCLVPCSLQGDLPLGGLCPGGLCLNGVSVQRGSLFKWGLYPNGVSMKGNRDSPDLTATEADGTHPMHTCF